jgi:hypothetical protein
VNLSSRETAIVLAALRLTQDNTEGINNMPQMDEHPGVAPWEIDELCEKINCAPAEENPGFDPAQEFESVAEAMRIIGEQPKAMAAAKAVILANIDRGELGFASDIVKELEWP